MGLGLNYYQSPLQFKLQDGIHNGICGEFGIAIDGGSKRQRQESQGEIVRTEGAVQEDYRDASLAPAPLWLLDV
ncbi:hypothetical protein AAHA92_27892 [Salvia divinorum]|uniref:Uncharacterized protein n=1 Tax=Salvia divinorum TaxID=28513 RepID=A0ABD1G5U0_SALDI